LIGEKLAAFGAGQTIKVAWMKGRSRAYAIDDSRNSALAVAFNDRCDAIVGTAVVAHPHPVAIEPGLVEFLNGKTVMDWATVALGL